MKRTRSTKRLALAALAATAAILVTGCTGSGQRENSDPAAQTSKKSAQYTCSMHPEVVQDKPGDCPKCGMKLVEKH